MGLVVTVILANISVGWRVCCALSPVDVLLKDFDHLFFKLVWVWWLFVKIDLIGNGSDIGKKKSTLTPFWLHCDVFFSGDILGLHLASNPLPMISSGIVTRVASSHISVAFDQSAELSDLGSDVQYYVVKLANDVTYRRLRRWVLLYLYSFLFMTFLLITNAMVFAERNSNCLNMIAG